MPIVDYALKAQQAKTKLFDRKDISETNKENLRRFLNAYDVSPARLNLFFRHIGWLLSNSKDIQEDLNNRDTINEIFKTLRKQLSPPYYSTVVNVSLRFVRWLNNGERPGGFKDIVNRSKSTQRRNLKPQDMISWKEGLKMINRTNSIQFKAIVMTQLDGGFRPSEYVDLNYGDIVKEGKYLVAQVSGKTGSRDVILWDCIPYLQRWLQEHPTKKNNDPLWITESINKGKGGEVKRYDYFAIQKRVRDLGERIGLGKPCDFYNLRHSSAVIKKLKNWPLDLAAKNMGHSVEFFDNVYGRLSLKDKTNRLDKVHGLKGKQEEDTEIPITCQICSTVNEPGKQICSNCGTPLTLTQALSEVANIKKTLTKQILELIRENPEDLRKALNL